MERLYRYVLAGNEESVFICSQCGEFRQGIKRCEHCGCPEYVTMTDMGEKFSHGTILALPTTWRREEIPASERLRFETFTFDSNVSTVVEFSKYPSKIPTSALRQIIQYKTYLAKILFGKLIKIKGNVEELREKLSVTANNPVIDEILNKYFLQEMNDLMNDGLSYKEVRSQVLSTFNKRIKDKDISSEDKETCINYIKKVHSVHECLMDAMKARRQETLRIAGEMIPVPNNSKVRDSKGVRKGYENTRAGDGRGFYDAIIGVYFVNEMAELIEKYETELLAKDVRPAKAKAKARARAEAEIRETLNERMVEKLGPKLGPVYKKYMDRIQSLSDVINKTHITAKTDGPEQLFEDRETCSKTDIAFLKDTNEELQAGDTRLALDAMPKLVRQLAEAMDCWHYSEKASKLFRLVDPITQVYENHAWGYESSEIEHDEPYRSVVRAYMEDVLHIREDIDDDSYLDAIGDVFDVNKTDGISLGRTDRIEYAGYIGEVADSEESDSDDIAEVTFRVSEPYQMLPELPKDIQAEVNKAVDEYYDILNKLDESTNFNEIQKGIIKSSAMQELEKRIDKLAGDELTLRYDSPYHCFGYSQPGRRYIFIKQYSDSNLINDGEERIKLFHTMAAEITDCTINGGRIKSLTDKDAIVGGLNYEYHYYKTIREKDHAIIKEWKDERRWEERDRRIAELRSSNNEHKKCLDEESIRKKIWSEFYMDKQKHEVDRDCKWLRLRTEAQRELFLTQPQRSNIYKFREIAYYRITRNYQDVRAAIKWAYNNYANLSVDSMYMWLQPIALDLSLEPDALEDKYHRKFTHAEVRQRKALFKNLCWVSNYLIDMLMAVDKGHDPAAHRKITKDESDRFLIAHKLIDEAETISDLNQIVQLMRRRIFLIVSDEPAEKPIETKVFWCNKKKVQCHNSQPCNSRVALLRRTIKSIQRTQRFQLMAKEEIGKDDKFYLKKEAEAAPITDEVFGVGPSFNDILTPLEEWYLNLMIVGKKDFLLKRLTVYPQLDALVKEEIETNLPIAEAICPRTMEEMRYFSDEDIRLKQPRLVKEKQCLAVTFAKPVFARLRGDRGHLFIRCEGCGQRVWLLKETDVPRDMKTLEEFND